MQMNDYIDLINHKLDDFIPIGYPQEIFKSMKYTVTLPGKRLRPVMCLETCRMLGGEIENAIPTACAIEMLHAQTLIHDDLPCMDNDDYRRGKLTNHKVFGEARAVLAGDALLTYAPQIITKYSKSLSPSVLIRVLNEFFHYAGAEGVIAGQVVDIESENNNYIDADKPKILEYLHIHKTSDLFQLSMRTGAIIAAKFPQYKQYFYNAENWGVEEAYKAFGPGMQTYTTDDFLNDEECQGRIWLILDFYKVDYYNEKFNNENYRLLAQKQYFTKYNKEKAENKETEYNIYLIEKIKQ